MAGGIYKILNIVNGKFYIGSAIDFDKRWKRHIWELNTNRHFSPYLTKAWLKYGQANFEFIVLETTEDLSKSNMMKLEQRWLDELKPYDTKIGYNLRVIADSNIGIKKAEITKLKMSIGNKGIKRDDKARKNMSIAQRKRKHRHTPERNEMIRVIYIGNTFRKGHKLSQETKNKISESMKRKKIFFIVKEATCEN